MSLAILKSDTAMVLRAPDAMTAASFPPWASKWSGASTNGKPGSFRHQSDDFGGEALRGVDPRPNCGSAQGQLLEFGQDLLESL